MSKAVLTYQEGDEPVLGYRLVKLLGGGGVGRAWRAVAPGGVDVAIKIVERLQEGGGRRELQGLEQIKNIPHNYVCKIYGFWAKNAQGQIVEPLLTPVSDSRVGDTTWATSPETEAVQLVIAMELGDETLADVYARHRQSTPPGKVAGLPVEQLLRYIETAGSAVDYLNCHHHICHCDIKPQNILIIGGEAKVCDFGLARHVVDSKETGTPAFTPQYGAPEMMVGATYHPRMDQYSLALTYAELRMGRFPFPAFSQVHSHSQLAALAREKWEGKYDLSGLSDAERTVLAKALSPNPDDRFESIGEMLKALHAAVFPAQAWSPSDARSSTTTSLKYHAGDEPVSGYRLTKLLGEGAVGETWRATGPGGVEVAIKIVNRLQEGGGQRELSGLERIKNIRHNHLCKIYGYWAKAADGRIVEPGAPSAIAAGPADTALPSSVRTDAVQLVIAMELGDETLADLFARYRQDSVEGKPVGMPVMELFDYIEAAGRAVDYLNQRYSICHCDLKPQNLLLVGGEAKVCDFGLARQVVDVRKTSTPAYTPQYGAPEMMVGAIYHPRMDQYSLALTYAELRAGRFPFPAFARASSDSQLAALAREKWEGKYDLSDLPKAERKVLAKALSPDPDDRFETIAEMLEALDRAVSAPPAPWIRRVVKSAVMGFLLVSVALAGWTVWPHLVPSERNGHGASAWVERVEECLDRFDRDGNLSQLDQAQSYLHEISPAHHNDRQVIGLKQRLADGYVRCAANLLQPFSESGDSSRLDEGMARIQQALSVDPGNERCQEVSGQFAAKCLEFADRHLRQPDVQAAEKYLRVFEQHLPGFSGTSRRSLESTWALHRARASAVGQDWERVKQDLGRAESGDSAFSPEDTARIHLLRTGVACQAAAGDHLEGLLKDIGKYREARRGFAEWEQRLADEFEAIVSERSLARWDSLTSIEQQLVGQLWPNLQFHVLFTRALAAARSDQREDLEQARSQLPKLKEMASLPQDKWSIEFLEILLNLKTPVDEARLPQVLSDFEKLLSTEGKAPESPDPAQLFEVLVVRFENALLTGKADTQTLAPVRTVWRLWGQFEEQAQVPDELLDTRLRILAVIAELAAEESGTVKDLAAPLVAQLSAASVESPRSAAATMFAESPWMPLIAAAWVEDLLGSDHSEKLLADNEAKSVLNAVRAAPPGELYPDYLSFVQALDLSRMQNQSRKAAEILWRIEVAKGFSPAMQVNRRRHQAGVVLMQALEESKAREADGILIPPFSAADAAWACRCVESVQQFWVGVPLDRREKLDFAENLVLAYAADRRDPDKWLSILNGSVLPERPSGALLVAQVQGACQRYAAVPTNSSRDAALRAYCDLLLWLDDPLRASLFRRQFDERLDEAWSLIEELPLMTEVKKLEISALVQQLQEPGAPLRKEINAVSDHASLAELCGLHGQRLHRRFDNSPEGILQRLQVFSIAAWLAPKRADFRVDLAETVKLIRDGDFEERLRVIESLAREAAEIQPEFHGAWGLKGYVAHQRARRGQGPSTSEQMGQAIEDYRRALKSQPPASLRARYLVGLSSALLESAFLIPIGRADRLDEQRELLQEAKKLATEATLIRDPIDPPEHAFIAKGHAEEDLAYYVGEYEQYETGVQSFTTAVNIAREARRAAAIAIVGRARCSLRQTQHAIARGLTSEAQVEDRLTNTVLTDLDMVTDGDAEPELRAEAESWKSMAFLELAKLKNRDRRRADIEAADQRCENAVRIAWDASLPNWSEHQIAWLRIARQRHLEGAADATIVRERAKTLLDAARAPVRGPTVRAVHEYEALRVYLLALMTEKRIEELRNELEGHLDRFPADDPQRIEFRARLLAERSLWTRDKSQVSDASDSLFEGARRDAETACELASEFAQKNPEEGARVLGMAHAALGSWFQSKFNHYTDLRRPSEAFGFGKRASEELTKSLQHYSTYRKNRGADETALLAEAMSFHLRLGVVNRDFLKNHAERLDPRDQDDLRKYGIMALRSLEPLLPRLTRDQRNNWEETLKQLEQ